MRRLWFVVSVLLAATPAMAEQGVSDDEVVIGSVNDLSGIFAAFGAPAVAGARLHFDEVNAAGGIHGRTIRFVVEDSSYQMPKAMQGFNKLINRDRVFAMILNLGTPMNVAGFKLTTPKNIPNISPLSAGQQMLAPPIRLRFATSTSNYDQMRLASRYMIESGKASKLCVMYIPSDFGKEVREAVSDEAAAHDGAAFVAETTHKPDETDFVGSLQKLAGEGCDMVAVALGLRQTITTVATANKLGLSNVRFVGPSGAFHSMVAKVPGGVTEGAACGVRLVRSRGARRRPGGRRVHCRVAEGPRRIPEYRRPARLFRGGRFHPGAGDRRARAYGRQFPQGHGKPRLLRPGHERAGHLRAGRSQGRGRHRPLRGQGRELGGTRPARVRARPRAVPKRPGRRACVRAEPSCRRVGGPWTMRANAAIDQSAEAGLGNMIRYRLTCDQAHEFEAWFRDSATFETQAEQGLLACPTCGSTAVTRALMAPSIARSARRDQAPETPVEPTGLARAVAMRQQLRMLRKHIEENCSYVGPRFAEEARRISCGESELEAIYGETSREEAEALRDEGITFGTVPWVSDDDA